MQVAAFSAKCPFEIGDKVVILEAAGENKERIRYTERSGVITDIACTHYLRANRVLFTYELDRSGEYIPLITAAEAGLTV